MVASSDRGLATSSPPPSLSSPAAEADATLAAAPEVVEAVILPVHGLPHSARSVVRLLCPTSVHLSDVYLHSKRPRTTRFEVRNEGADDVEVVFAWERGAGTLEFWSEADLEKKEAQALSLDVLLPSRPVPSSSSLLSNRGTHSGQSLPTPLSSLVIPSATTVTVGLTYFPPLLADTAFAASSSTFPASAPGVGSNEAVSTQPLLSLFKPTASSPGFVEDTAELFTPRVLPRPDSQDSPSNDDEDLLATPSAKSSAAASALARAPTFWLDSRDGSASGSAPSSPESLLRDLPRSGSDVLGGQGNLGKPPTLANSGSTALVEPGIARGNITLFARRLPGDTRSGRNGSGSGTTTSPLDSPNSLSARSTELPEVFTIPFSASISESHFTAFLPHDSALNPTQLSVDSLALPQAPSADLSLLHPSTGGGASSLAYVPCSAAPALLLDFGLGSDTHNTFSRTFVLVNNSPIPLEIAAEVTFNSSPWQDWAFLEDTETEIETSLSRGNDRGPLLLPVIPSSSSRIFRITVSPTEASDFSIDLLFTNLHDASNTLLIKAAGHCYSSKMTSVGGSSDVLQVLTGSSLNFGDLVRGSTAKQLILLKNTGDEPIEVSFDVEAGIEAKFRFGGVKGDELDDEAEPGRSPRLLNAVAGLDALRRAGESQSSLSSGNFLNRKTPSASSSSNLHAPRPVLSSDWMTLPTSRPSSPARLSHDGSPTSSVPSEDGLSSASAQDLSGRSSPSRSHSRASRHTRDSDDTHETDGSSTSAPPIRPSPLASRSSMVGVAHFRDPHAQIHQYPHHHPSQQSSSSWGVDNSSSATSNANQIEELVLRPGTEYRVWVSYTPSRTAPLFADPGRLVPASFRATLDYYSASSIAGSSSARSASRTKPNRRRRVISCVSRECSSVISVSPSVLDFGTVTVGSSKHESIAVTNNSDLPAKIELRFISKVLSASRIFVTIGPRETTLEKIDFFPRRINNLYTKQLNVRNLLDRSNDQLVEIRAKNVDLDGVTLHSSLYKILTPSGKNFLDFGNVVVGSPAIRTVSVVNVQASRLRLQFDPAHPEDLQIYVKAVETPKRTTGSGVVGGIGGHCVEGIPEEGAGGPGGAGGQLVELDELPDKKSAKPTPTPISNRERFLEAMANRSEQPSTRFPTVKLKQGAKGATKQPVDGETPPKAINMVNAIKKGSKGRSIVIYGNVVLFKDRSLLCDSEYLDLPGPPQLPHRMQTHASRLPVLTAIENEDPRKIAYRCPKIMKTAFEKTSKKDKPPAASGNDDAIPSLSSKTSATPRKKTRKTHEEPPVTERETASGLGGDEATSGPSGASSSSPAAVAASAAAAVTAVGARSPALTGRRKQRAAPVDAADVSRLSIDELISTLEHQDNLSKNFKAGQSSSREAEELYVRTWINLRKALDAAIESGKLIPAHELDIAGGGERQLVFVLCPSGSTRPHVTGDRSRKQDSRIFIRIVDFDRGLAAEYPGLAVEDEALPVRELLVRSNMTRSILEVAQAHVNFGSLEKGETLAKTIIIHNRSECPGMFRIRLSGSIGSNDFKLAEGRYGIIEPFGKREVSGFVFTPSMAGLFNEKVHVENAQDADNNQQVTVKATVRKSYTFWVTPLDIDFKEIDISKSLEQYSGIFTVQNKSKGDRSYVVEVDEKPLAPGTGAVNATETAPCCLSLELSQDETRPVLTEKEDTEIEEILRKLKIQRRKGKLDKVEKLEARLTELGVPIPPATAPAAGADSATATATTTTAEGSPSASIATDSALPTAITTPASVSPPAAVSQTPLSAEAVMTSEALESPASPSPPRPFDPEDPPILPVSDTAQPDASALPLDLTRVAPLDLPIPPPPASLAPKRPNCSRLIIPLAAGQAQNIKVSLALAQPPERTSDSPAAQSISDKSLPATEAEAETMGTEEGDKRKPMPWRLTLRVWEKKNADDVRVLAVNFTS